MKRYETKGDTVVLYFDEIKSDLTCVSLDVHAVFRVEDVKSSTVKVYDYYQSEYSASSSYILPSGPSFHPYFEKLMMMLEINVYRFIRLRCGSSSSTR